jgi:cytochrome c6
MATAVNALRSIDKALSIGSWLTAGVLVVMLFVGPAVIASDKAERGTGSAGAAVYGKGAGVDGGQVFKDSCGSCHTLSAAGTNGAVGPNLDDTTLSTAEIEATVRGGRGSMPSFDGQLSDAQIAAVAAFVDASN